jgi:hypothetical protein
MCPVNEFKRLPTISGKTVDEKRRAPCPLPLPVLVGSSKPPELVSFSSSELLDGHLIGSPPLFVKGSLTFFAAFLDID